MTESAAASADRDRRRRRDPARRPRRADASGRTSSEGRYSDQRGRPAERWDPALLLRPGPQGARQDLLEDRRLGARLRVGPARLAPADPAEGRDAMDDAQKWAVGLHAQALLDYGWPERPLDLERTAVVLGNAMAGEQHYLHRAARSSSRSTRASSSQLRASRRCPTTSATAIVEELRERARPPGSPASPRTPCRASSATSSPGGSPTSSTSAARTSSSTPPARRRWPRSTPPIEGLERRRVRRRRSPAASTATWAPSTFVKFCKIGALSATGTRPYADGADGFVMGEGAALFVLKRLADAERDGDRIYAVIRGIGGASDGKGKGITAPNPVGQRLAIERGVARRRARPARLLPTIEGHGTSTRVGDVVEVESLGRGVRRRGPAPGIGRARLGEVEHRPPEGRRRAPPGMLKAVLALAPQGDAAEPRLRATRTRTSTWPHRRSQSTPSCASGRRRTAATCVGRRERLRLRRDQLPRRARGVRARAAHRAAVQRRDRRAPADVGDRRPPPRAAKAPAARRRWCSAPTTRPGSPSELAADRRAEARPGGARARARPTRPTLRAPERIAIDYGDAAELAEQGGAGPQGARRRTTRPPGRRSRGQGIFRGAGAARQGRLPLHRPGLAVREHAGRAAPDASRSSPRRSPRPTE